MKRLMSGPKIDEALYEMKGEGGREGAWRRRRREGPEGLHLATLRKLFNMYTERASRAPSCVQRMPGGGEKRGGGGGIKTFPN